jgi:nucleoside-diphosphate-sugar epimerase
MRILITGATGFLGGNLTRRLLRMQTPVRILARDPAAARQFVERGAELIVGAITDATALRRALEGVTVVYHLAGRLFIPGTPEDEYRTTHIEGTRLLLDRCAEAPTSPRIVQCSTTGVLGVTGNQPVDETAPYRPTNTYEASKMEAERLVRERIAHGYPAVIVRPGLVYGPGDLHLLGFFRAIQRGLFRPIGRAPVWLHPIYIDDMIDALARCGQDLLAIGECFHIAGREPVTLATLAATIAASLGVTVPRGHIPMAAASALALAGDLLPAPLRSAAPLTRSRLDFLTHSRVYTVTKALRLLDFCAATELETGVSQTVAWYQQEGYLPRQAAA